MLIAKDCAVPGQEFKLSAMVIEAVIKLLPELTVVNAGIVPLPPAAKPMLLLLFNQVKLAPGGVLTRFTAATLSPGQ